MLNSPQEKLLPCPFCGREPELREPDENYDSRMVCSLCHVNTPKKGLTKEQAIQWWNTRAPLPAQRAVDVDIFANQVLDRLVNGSFDETNLIIIKNAFLTVLAPVQRELKDEKERNESLRNLNGQIRLRLENAENAVKNGIRQYDWELLRQERDVLRSQNQSLQEESNSFVQLIGAVEALIDKEFNDGKSVKSDDLLENLACWIDHHTSVETERNNLKKDKERLDWLSKSNNMIGGTVGTNKTYFNWTCMHDKTFREALDSAMSQQEKK